MATKKIKTDTASFTISAERLTELVSKMIDLTRINDEIIFKFSSDRFFIYSTAGLNNNIHAFKSYVYSSKELFKKSPQLDIEILFILTNAKVSSSVLNFYNKYVEDIEIKLYYNDDGKGEKIDFKNSKLSDWFKGEIKSITKIDVDIDRISEIMNTDIADYSFMLSKNDFDVLKSKSRLVEKANDIYYLTIKNKKLYLGQNNSSVFIQEVDRDDEIVAFPKKYFNTLNFEKQTEIKIWMFETFLLAISDTTNLLVMTELTV